MKKLPRILAFTGAVLLILLYIGTLVLALVGTPAAADLLKASVALTIVIPVLLYGYIIIYRITNKNDDSDTPSSDQ